MVALFIILFLAFIGYMSLQLWRNDLVFRIRIKWINTNDERYDRYTYNGMYAPKYENWYGLKIPTDKDYV